MEARTDTPDRESIARARFVSTLRPPAHIHLSAICGTGMAAVATLLKQLGFRITGSDKAFYPPMGEIVRGITDELFEGYNASHLAKRPALVVIGNNLSRGNPEVEYVLENGIPYASMPEVFQALLIGDYDHCATSVVVAGTHGKTTTTAATALLLEVAGRRPGFFIGGKPLDLSAAIRAVDCSIPRDQRTVVLEGDEYDSAFFAKWPKFHSYRPDIAVITSIEFDHADIYSCLEEIEREFTKLVNSVSESGAVLICDQSPALDRLYRSQRGLVAAKLCRYGTAPDSPYRLVSRTPLKDDGQSLELSLDGETCTFSSPLAGEHNAFNLLAAAAVGQQLGVSRNVIATALSQFRGVARRQQLIGEWGGVSLIEDFAHHPTAVRVTLQGLREQWPARRIVAVFEPRSNTSRRGFFQQEYAQSFAAADVIVIREVENAGGYTATNMPIRALDVPRLVGEIRMAGKEAQALAKIDEIKALLLAIVRGGDLIVCMSNGDFGGLVPALREEFARRV